MNTYLCEHMHLLFRLFLTYIQCESKNPPPPRFCGKSSKTVLNFFNQILRAYYAFISMLDYEILFNYLQLWQSYATLSMTTHFKSCAQNVHHWTKCTLAFSDIFPKQLRIFSPNFTSLLNVHIYVRIQIFIHLSPTVTKLCHIKCHHSACVSTLWWSRIIWHNFVSVADNWIKICSSA